MREIKFRAWDKEYKKMMEWGKQLKGLTQNGIKTVMSYNSESGWSDCCNLKDIDLMQYTGLKDKNGVEIYEGDTCIVNLSYFKIKDEKAKVIFRNGAFQFQYGSERFFSKPYDAWNEVEVIGNIYENPDLLEATT